MFGRRETWAVLDDRWVERLEFPAWCRPLLEAYGVHVLQGWPDTLPSLSWVLSRFAKVERMAPFESPKKLDLEQVTEDIKAADIEEDCDLSTLMHIQLRSSTLRKFNWKWCLGTCSVLVLLLGLLPQTLACITAGVLGLCLGAILMLGYLWYGATAFRVKRRVLQACTAELASVSLDR